MAIQLEVEVVKQKEVQTFETPIFYKHIVSEDDYYAEIRGVITDSSVISIHKTSKYDSLIYEIEKERNFSPNSYKAYITNPEYRSSKEEFKVFYDAMLDFLVVNEPKL